MDERERSTEDIRQDIAIEKEKISQKVDQISDRIKEKLDWREYVREYPYMVIGVGACLGYVVSRILVPPTTPMERIMHSIADEVRGSLGDVMPRTADPAPGLIKGALLGSATKAATDWMRKAITT